MKPYFQNAQTKLYQGNVFEVLPQLSDESVHCIVTSPPYWQLRDYGHPDQIGNEPTLSKYIQNLVNVFEQCRRILKSDGTFWLNIGDTYASKWAVSRRNKVGNGSLEDGSREHRPNRLCENVKEKDLCLVPQRLAIALQDAGWYVRQDIVWHKLNPLPESMRDRCTKAHEYLFLLTKSPRYFWNYDAVQEPAMSKQHSSALSFNRETKEALAPGQSCKQHRLGRKAADIAYETRNARSVWSIASQPYTEAHFATMPSELVRRCIVAGCPEGRGTVLDPFTGSGTTLWQAQEMGRKAIGVELNPEYCELAFKRCRQQTIFGVTA